MTRSGARWEPLPIDATIGARYVHTVSAIRRAPAGFG